MSEIPADNVLFCGAVSTLTDFVNEDGCDLSSSELFSQQDEEEQEEAKELAKGH
jgi:hypothetical protein